MGAVAPNAPEKVAPIMVDYVRRLFCSVLYSRPRSEGWPHHGRTFSIYPCPLSFWLTLPRRVLTPVHVLMLSIQAVRGLPRLRAPGIVPCTISFSRQLPCFLMVWRLRSFNSFGVETLVFPCRSHKAVFTADWTDLTWPAPSWPSYTPRHWSRASASRSWLAVGLQCAHCSSVQFSSSVVNAAWCCMSTGAAKGGARPPPKLGSQENSRLRRCTKLCMIWQPNILNNCYELSGGYAPPPTTYQGLCPWTPLGDFRSPDPLCPHLQILATPLLRA